MKNFLIAIVLLFAAAGCSGLNQALIGNENSDPLGSYSLTIGDEGSEKVSISTRSAIRAPTIEIERPDGTKIKVDHNNNLEIARDIIDKVIP